MSSTTSPDDTTTERTPGEGTGPANGRRRRRMEAAIATVSAVLMGVAIASPAAADPTEGPLPVPFSIQAGVLAALDPLTPPPGANNWDCTPTPERPRPVILVNPTFTTQALAWQAGAPLLSNAGYCVFTFNHGNVTPDPRFPAQAVGDIPEAAHTLADMVDRVLAATGAHEVDLVGHSQGGGLLPDYYLTQLGGAEKVHTKVGISPSTGTTLSTLVWLRSLIPVIGPHVYGSIEDTTPGLTQQVYDSEIARQVYPEGAAGVPGVEMYSVISEYDEVVTPFVRQYYAGPGVTNILLQDECEADHSEHVSTLYSERALRYALNALEPGETAPVECFPVAPFAPWVT